MIIIYQATYIHSRSQFIPRLTILGPAYRNDYILSFKFFCYDASNQRYCCPPSSHSSANLGYLFPSIHAYDFYVLGKHRSKSFKSKLLYASVHHISISANWLSANTNIWVIFLGKYTNHIIPNTVSGIAHPQLVVFKTLTPVPAEAVRWLA